MTSESIKNHIKKIQDELGISSKKMAEFTNMNTQSYRNCCSNQNPTNNFKDIHLEILKSNIHTKIKELV